MDKNVNTKVHRHTISWGDVVDRRVNRLMALTGIDRSAAVTLLIMRDQLDIVLTERGAIELDELDTPPSP